MEYGELDAKEILMLFLLFNTAYT